MVLYPIDQAKEVLQFYRAYSANAPDDLTVFAGLLTTADGLPVVAVIAAWFGSSCHNCHSPPAARQGPISNKGT
jgi:hypothetical protein